MTVVLEQRLAFGRTVVAALVRNSIVESHSDKHVSITGSRTPVVLLIRHGDDVTAFTMQGDPVPLAQVENLCPGAIEDLVATEPL